MLNDKVIKHFEKCQLNKLKNDQVRINDYPFCWDGFSQDAEMEIWQSGKINAANTTTSRRR